MVRLEVHGMFITRHNDTSGVAVYFFPFQNSPLEKQLVNSFSCKSQPVDSFSEIFLKYFSGISFMLFMLRNAIEPQTIREFLSQTCRIYMYTVGKQGFTQNWTYTSI